MLRHLIEAAVCCDKGSFRDDNEDNYLLNGALSAGKSSIAVSSQSYQCYAVCDGMGGEAAGERASHAAVSFLATCTRNSCFGSREALTETLYRANQAVCDANPEPPGTVCGTTLVLLCFTPGGMHLAHIGDSRAYLLRGGRLERLTADHTRAQWLISSQNMKAEDIPADQLHVITRYLGRPERDGIRISPEIVMSRSVAPGDRLLLCSDGVHDVLGEEDILTALSLENSLEAAQALVNCARKKESQDNATALVCTVRGVRSGIRALFGS